MKGSDRAEEKKARSHRRKRNLIARELRTNPLYQPKIKGTNGYKRAHDYTIMKEYEDENISSDSTQ